jgi:hypothetical protein
LRAVGEDASVLSQAQELRQLLDAGDLPTNITRVSALAKEIDVACRQSYDDRRRRRLEEYSKAIEEIQSQPEFAQVEASQRETFLQPLRRRAVPDSELSAFSASNANSGASARSLEEDLDLLPSLRMGALGQLRQAVEPPPKTEDGIEVIRLSDFLPKTQALDEMSEDEIEKAIERLREKLYSLRELKRKAVWD